MEIRSNRANNLTQKRITLLSIIKPNRECLQNLKTGRSLISRIKYKTIISSKDKRALSVQANITLLSQRQNWQSKLQDQVYQGNMSFDSDFPNASLNKMKSLKIKFGTFRPKMHLLIEQRKRLRCKFKIAVRLIIWIIQRNLRKKMSKKIERRRLTRLKTKVFETLPFQTDRGQQDIIIIDHMKYSTPLNEIEMKCVHKPQYLKSGLQSFIQSRYNKFDKSSSLLPLVSMNRDLTTYKERRQNRDLPNSLTLKTEKIICQKSQSSPYLNLPPTLSLRTIPIKEQDVRSHNVTPTTLVNSKSEQNCQSKLRIKKRLGTNLYM